MQTLSLLFWFRDCWRDWTYPARRGLGVSPSSLQSLPFSQVPSRIVSQMQKHRLVISENLRTTVFSQSPKEQRGIPVCCVRSWADDFVKMSVRGTRSACWSPSEEMQLMPLVATQRELLAVWLKACSVFLHHHDCFYQTLHGRLLPAFVRHFMADHGTVLVWKSVFSWKCHACS